MAQFYATGPVELWVGVGGGGTPVFLGHGQRAPRLQILRRYADVHTDISGGLVPHDKGYAGEMGLLTVSLKRYNESTLAILQDVATVGTALIASRGVNDPGEIGSLMVTEGLAYQLWARFPFAAKTAYAAGTGGAMPAGYRMAAAFLEGPDDLDDLGPPGARTVGLVFTCLRTFDPTVTNPFGTGRFRLYDNNMAAVAGLAFN